jgi:hypothetical protein
MSAAVMTFPISALYFLLDVLGGMQKRARNRCGKSTLDPALHLFLDL